MSNVNHQASLQVRLDAISNSSVTEDRAMTLPGVSQEVLQQQFMFAVAIHEDAAQTRRLLGQMQQVRQSLLQAARAGGFAMYTLSGMLLHYCKHEGFEGGDA